MYGGKHTRSDEWGEIEHDPIFFNELLYERSIALYSSCPTSLPGDKIGKRYGEEASAYLLINRRIPAVIPTRIKIPVFLRRYTISSPYRFAVVKRAISAKGMPQDK